MKYGEEEEVEVMDKKVFMVKQSPFFYSQAPGHYQQDLLSKRLNLISIEEQAVQFCPKDPLFSKAIENLVYDAPGEVNMVQPGWQNLMLNILRPLQEERRCRANREYYRFRFLMLPKQKDTA